MNKWIFFILLSINFTVFSFRVQNNIGKGSTLPTMPVNIKQVSVLGIRGVPGQFDSNYQKFHDIADSVVGNAIDDVNIPKKVTGLTLAIGNKVYFAKLPGNIPVDETLQIVSSALGSYQIKSLPDSGVSLTILLRNLAGQKADAGIDITQLPPTIFSIHRMTIAGLNPMSG